MGDFIDKIADFFEDPPQWVFWVFGSLGVIFCELIYIQSADEVRLLWVLLFLPIGATVGFLIFKLIGLLLALFGYGAVIALIFGTIYGVFWLISSFFQLLYDTVLWEK